MQGKLLAIVVGRGFEHGANGRERGNHSAAYGMGAALDHVHNSTAFARCAFSTEDAIDFVVSYRHARLDIAWAPANGADIGQSAPALLAVRTLGSVFAILAYTVLTAPMRPQLFYLGLSP
jgi:hypothetical protein